MNNGKITAAFLNSTDASTKNDILLNIAIHYGISTQEVLEEVTDEEAESLLDYVTGSMRSAVSVLMQKFTYSLKVS